MRNIYITQNGDLEKKGNTLVFSNEETKKVLPVKDVDVIYAFSEVNFNTKLLEFLTKNEIPVFFYNYYSYYIGTYSPRQENLSGKLLVEQTKHYYEDEKRIVLAKEFLRGAIHNMRKTMMQYGLEKESDRFSNKLKELDRFRDVKKLLLFEAEVRQYYYRQFNKITKDDQFKFVKRVRNPPDNYINTLISFGNSLLYTTCLSEILKTQLDPRISYLHEPFERRYSLNLDISEIFKPLIVDRVIFNLINKNMLKEEHFDKQLNYCYLNKEGRNVFLKEFDSKLKSTLKYPGLNRSVSYKYMLRLECHKIIKHLLEGADYKSFRIYW